MDDMDALIATPPGWQYQLSDYEARRVREVMDELDRHSAWLELSRFGNGFVRQAAVRGLAAQPSAEALVALLERLNDWVPQVRQEAAAAVEAYWVPEHAGLLLQTLAPLLALAGKQRADHGATLERASAVLQLAQVRDQVQGAFGTCRGKAARFVFELLLKGVEDRPALLAMALRHPEVSVRQMAVDACAELPDEQALPLLEEVMRSCGSRPCGCCCRAWPIVASIWRRPCSTLRGPCVAWPTGPRRAMGWTRGQCCWPACSSRPRATSASGWGYWGWSGSCRSHRPMPWCARPWLRRR